MPTRQDVIDDLQRVFSNPQVRPTASNYRQHGRYSMGPIYSNFENWEAAKEAAGVNRKLENPRKIDREKLLDDIRRVHDMVDGIVTYAQYEERGQYSLSVIERRFDDWPNARAGAGIEGTPEAHNRVSVSEAKQALKELADEIGRTPRRADVEDWERYSYAMYERKFGSWNEALIACGFEVNQPTDAETVRMDCDNCGVEMVREMADVNDKNSVFCSEECFWEYLSENAPSGEEHHQYNRVERNCANCGELLQIKPSVSENRDRVFCDYECAGQWRSDHRSGENAARWQGGDETLSCEVCGEHFEVRPAKADEARFCSYECLGIHHREVRSGEDNPNWLGGYEPYKGPNWREQRQKARERDGYTCVACGMTQEESLNQYDERLSVHHRVPFRDFKKGDEADYEAANRLENLVTLCRTCHKTWEHMPVQLELPELKDR